MARPIEPPIQVKQRSGHYRPQLIGRGHNQLIDSINASFHFLAAQLVYKVQVSMNKLLLNSLHTASKMARTAAQRRARIMLLRYLQLERIRREQQEVSEFIAPPLREFPSEPQVVPTRELQIASESSSEFQVVPTRELPPTPESSLEPQVVPDREHQVALGTTRPSLTMSANKFQVVPTRTHQPRVDSVCPKCHRKKRRGRRHSRR